MRLRARWVGAAVLVLWASCVQAQVGDAESRRPADQQQRPAELTPLPIEIVEDEAEAEARRNAQQRAEQREIEDLAAQQGMNESTQRMTDLAGWQTFLILVGTIALIVTLYFTREANAAAREAVKVTRDIGERQIRAYVIIWNVRVINFKMGERAKVIFDIDNRGQTPAIILKLAIGTRTDADPNRVKIKDIKSHEMPSIGVIGGQTNMPQPRTMLISENDANAVAFFAGEKAYVIGGYLIYRDIFGKTRRSVFRCKLTLNQIEDGNGFFMLCARNNRFS